MRTEYETVYFEDKDGYWDAISKAGGDEIIGSVRVPQNHKNIFVFEPEVDYLCELELEAITDFVSQLNKKGGK